MPISKISCLKLYPHISCTLKNTDGFIPVLTIRVPIRGKIVDWDRPMSSDILYWGWHSVLACMMVVPRWVIGWGSYWPRWCSILLKSLGWSPFQFGRSGAPRGARSLGSVRSLLISWWPQHLLYLSWRNPLCVRLWTRRFLVLLRLRKQLLWMARVDKLSKGLRVLIEMLLWMIQLLL